MGSETAIRAAVREEICVGPTGHDVPMLSAEDALAGNITEVDRDRFARAGFAVVIGLLPGELVERLRSRFEPLFRGEFETGIFPDEWYWREGISLPDATRHMANAWKSDGEIGSLVLSRRLARIAASLMGWRGIRLGTDTLWWKPTGASEIALHQDDSYSAYLDPGDTVTCWYTLDDTDADGGTIEYAEGSNHWRSPPNIGDFHRPEDYRAAMRAAAAAAGVDLVRIVRLAVPAGSCVIHSGQTWHGSDRNRHADRPRRSIAAHLLQSGTKFRDGRGGYTYGRYKRHGETAMDENFFPILWSSCGHRSAHIDEYYTDAFLEAAPAPA